VPLEYRNGWPGELEVLSDALTIASIGRRGAMWTWTLYVSPAPAGLKVRGTADSLENAKRELEQHWSTWLDVAGLTARRKRRPEN
jgi:hypothetical protein